jgi:hypothetical protein
MATVAIRNKSFVFCFLAFNVLLSAEAFLFRLVLTFLTASVLRF